MLITEIKELDKKRSIIKTDEDITFALYKKEIRYLNLEEGKELSHEEYGNICNEILIKRARKRAMFLLEKMDRTESQLRDKLRQGLYGEEIVEDAVAYVKKYHYIDDERYAGNYTRYQKARKSRRQIQMDLLQKGIAREQIEMVLEREYETEDEQELICKWIEKKHYSGKDADLKEKQKMYQFLMRKGFHSQDIMYALNQYENRSGNQC